MSHASRQSWRLFAAIVQIAILVAFAVPGVGHAHGGHHADGVYAASPSHHVCATGDERVADAAVAAPSSDDASGGSTHAPCCVGCCGHAFLPGSDAAAPPMRRAARAIAPPADVSFADLTPEALPKPPRPFV